jgi:hypothetical protein
MARSRSPYDILGVHPGVTDAELQEAFRTALRRRTHPPAEIRHAFEQLRSPRSRLRHDLLHPEPVDVRALIEPVLEGAGRGSPTDDGSVPLPGWQDIVRPDLGGRETVERPLPPAAGPPVDRTPRGPAHRDVVPPFEFPDLP